MIKACIFDLDGTVLDTLKALSHTMTLTMRSFGLGDIDEEHTKSFVGDGYRVFVEKSLKYAGDRELRYLDEACEKYLELFKENCLYEVKPYEGITDTLKALKDKKIKLAILSNKSQERAEDNIYNIVGRDIFDAVYGERAGIPRKPDPASLKALMKELGAAPSECLYFGDTDTDMQTGISAGAKTVGVLWGFRGRTELESFKPYALIEKPSDIINLL